MTKRSKWRSVLGSAFAVAALSGGLGLATVSTAHASTEPVYTFVPIRLTVHDIQDNDVFPWWDNRDEPHMYYGNTEWADVVYRGGTYGIPSVDFTGSSISVDLWERDGGWIDTDHLGFETASVAQLNQELEMKFKANSWDYELKYKIVPA